MILDNKIIGLCVARIEEKGRGLFVERLYHALSIKGYKVVCFCGSEEDEVTAADSGRQTIYDRVDYQVLDGMIICKDHFGSSGLAEVLQEHAENKTLPTVMLTDTLSGEMTTANCTLLSKEFGELDFSWEPQQQELTPERIVTMMENREKQAKALSESVKEMLDNEEARHLYQPLAKAIFPSSWVCLNSRFMKLVFGNQTNQYTTVAIPTWKEKDWDVKYMDDSQMLPDGEEWVQDSSMYLITMLQGKNINCGFLAIRTGEVQEISKALQMFTRFVDLAFHSLINQYIFRNMVKEMRNSAYMDHMTGLCNLQGATKWFEEFAASQCNHEKRISVTVYAMPKYSYLYETFGIREVEQVVVFLAEKLKQVYTRDCFLAKISNGEFIVINYFDPGENVDEVLNTYTAAYFAEIEHYNRNSEKEYYVEVNSGCTVADPGWNGTLEGFVKYATSEMFLNRLKKGITDTVKDSRLPQEFYSVFNLLVENNLFTYHFQPIVDAKTGDICAYEALMRTSGGINMSPMEILDTARAYKRLDDVEHATLFNVMQKYVDDQEKFYNRKLFINTIPKHFVDEESRVELQSRFMDYLDNFVFEVTEQDSVSDEELDALKRLCGKSGESNIAIDDYGSGHSNIVNLLRYEPQIIKIDHYLVNGIESDTNKQMFVKNTIEFAALNHIKVLAEGVETFEELQTVIEYGVDYIQGFYTSKATPEPLAEIPEDIKNEIIGENLRLMKFNNDKQKVYTAKSGETVNLVALALQQYVGVNIISGDVRIVGKKDSTISMVIKVADNADARIELVDVNLIGTDETAIQLGKGSNVEMNIQGYNAIYKDGILVPKNSRLLMTGDGNLLINANRNFGVGIGANFNTPYGEIIFDMEGRVRITATGDKIVGVGGEKSDSAIILRKGRMEISGSGITALGVGSANGDADIRIGRQMVLLVKESANDSIGIGTIKGTAKIVTEGDCTVVADGERAVAVGTFKGNAPTIHLVHGSMKATVHCDSGAVIGTHSGGAAVVCNDCEVQVYGEGACVAGIGSYMGNCITEINGGTVASQVLSAGAMPFGDVDDRVIITGGNVLCLNDDIEVTAYNAYGQKLTKHLIDEDYFEKVIPAEEGEYLYSARRSKDYNKLAVFLPY